MSYTKGPWKVSARDTFGAGLHPAKGLFITGSNEAGVSKIAFLWDEDVEEEQASNARLIATAPEMLEALSAAEKMLDVLWGCSAARSEYGWDKGDSKTLDYIRTTIKKAKGEIK